MSGHVGLLIYLTQSPQRYAISIAMSIAALPLIPWSKTPILTARNSAESSKLVLDTVLDLFVLGLTEQGDALLNALQNHGRVEESSNASIRETLDILHMACKDREPSPSWIKRREPPIAWQRGVPGEIARKFEYGTLMDEDAAYVLERLNAIPGDDNTAKNVTIGAAAQVALLAGDEMVATKLVNEDVKELYQRLQEAWDDSESDGDELRTWQQDRLGLQFSPEIWKVLNKNTLRDSFHVNEETLNAFVDEGCALIKKRFTQGPSNLHANKTVPGLLHLIDENYTASYKTRIGARPSTHFNARSVASLKDTHLKPGASEDEITALIERLAKPIPTEYDSDDEWDYGDGDDFIKRSILPEKELSEHYKDFLRTSNGLVMREDCYQNLVLHSTDSVTKGAKWLWDKGYHLFPLAYTMGDVDHIPLGEFTCFTMGYGNGEHQVILLPPSSVKPAVQQFEKMYAVASEEHKKLYEQAALELYGGLENLSAVEWLCIKGRHTNTEQEVWGSFRGYLESCVDDAVKDERRARIEVKKFNEKEELDKRARKERREKRKREEQEAAQREEERDVRELNVDSVADEDGARELKKLRTE